MSGVHQEVFSRFTSLNWSSSSIVYRDYYCCLNDVLALKPLPINHQCQPQCSAFSALIVVVRHSEAGISIDIWPRSVHSGRRPECRLQPFVLRSKWLWSLIMGIFGIGPGRHCAQLAFRPAMVGMGPYLGSFHLSAFCRSAFRHTPVHSVSDLQTGLHPVWTLTLS